MHESAIYDMIILPYFEEAKKWKFMLEGGVQNVEALGLSTAPDVVALAMTPGVGSVQCVLVKATLIVRTAAGMDT